jgi:hypothetical protein
MKTSVELIDAMIKLLTPPANWIKKTSAKDANGVSCNPRDSAATCWCLQGARIKLYMAAGASFDSLLVIRVRQAIDVAASKRGYVSGAHFNDDKRTTHRGMLNFLEEVKILAKEVEA